MTLSLHIMIHLSGVCFFLCALIQMLYACYLNFLYLICHLWPHTNCHSHPWHQGEISSVALLFIGVIDILIKTCTYFRRLRRLAPGADLAKAGGAESKGAQIPQLGSCWLRSWGEAFSNLCLLSVVACRETSRANSLTKPIPSRLVSMCSVSLMLK